MHGDGAATGLPYRRARDGAASWHFCVCCSGWPRAHYTGSALPPRDGGLCRQCVARHLTGACTEGCAERRAALAAG